MVSRTLLLLGLLAAMGGAAAFCESIFGQIRRRANLRNSPPSPRTIFVLTSP
jgi:hypothetical protein